MTESGGVGGGVGGSDRATLEAQLANGTYGTNASSASPSLVVAEEVTEVSVMDQVAGVFSSFGLGGGGAAALEPVVATPIPDGDDGSGDEDEADSGIQAVDANIPAPGQSKVLHIDREEDDRDLDRPFVARRTKVHEKLLEGVELKSFALQEDAKKKAREEEKRRQKEAKALTRPSSRPSLSAPVGASLPPATRPAPTAGPAGPRCPCPARPGGAADAAHQPHGTHRRR